MFYPNDTYRNLTGDNYKPTEEAKSKREFDKSMNAEAERIVNMLPAVLDEIINEGAAVLFDQLPECMKCEDAVTHDIMTEANVRRILAMKVSNKLGRGASFLQK